MTLLELIAVMTLMAIFAAVAMVRLGVGVQEQLEVDTCARRLARDLTQARQRTLASGDRHFVVFSMNDGGVQGYRLCRRTPQGDESVEEPREFPNGMSVSVSHGEAGFAFDGSALAPYEFRLSNAQHTQYVRVVPATGSVRVTPEGA